MENETTTVECMNCHNLVEIPFNKIAIQCPDCGVLLIAYNQELPCKDKNSSSSENNVLDK